MAQQSVWRGAMIIAVCVALAVPARAETSLKTAATEIVIGIVVVAAAAVVLTVVLVHKSKKTAITGCVRSGDAGLTITDEKDRQIYALTGETAGVKPGDRMKLQGKKIRSKDKRLVWETKAVGKDFGVCRP